MQNEIWKPIQGYKGFYEVSNQGRVRGMDRLVNLPDGRKRKAKGIILKPKRNKDGYLFVSLSGNGFTKTGYIHRLVATAYIPNPWNLPEVNHLDGNKSNNLLENLEWCTHQDNVQHAYDIGLSSNQGGSHSMAVGVIDNLLGREFETIKDWCAARGINYSTGRNILNGQKNKKIDLTGVIKFNMSE